MIPAMHPLQFYGFSTKVKMLVKMVEIPIKINPDLILGILEMNT